MKITKIAFLLLANILPQTVRFYKLSSTWLILAWESAKEDLNIMKGNVVHSVNRILLLIYY